MGLAASKQEAFWEACGFGNTETVVEFLMDPNVNVNWVSYTHGSAPIHAASQGKADIVKILLNHNCDVNAKDEHGNLALHQAAMKGHGQICEMLIAGGSQVSTPNKNGWTALINSAYWCHPEVVRLLIRHKTEVHLQNHDDRTALHEACRSQSSNEKDLERIVRMLIEAGVDVNQKSSDHGEADFTPLMFATYHGHTGAARALIEANCDINVQGTNGWTALHWAADRGHQEMIRLLLCSNADLLLRDKRNLLALNRSATEEIHQILLGATCKARRDKGLPSDDEEDNNVNLKVSRSSNNLQSGQMLTADQSHDGAPENLPLTHQSASGS